MKRDPENITEDKRDPETITEVKRDSEKIIHHLKSRTGRIFTTLIIHSMSLIQNQPVCYRENVHLLEASHTNLVMNDSNAKTFNSTLPGESCNLSPSVWTLKVGTFSS